MAYLNIDVILFNRCPNCRRNIDSGMSAENFPRNLMVENMIENMVTLSVAPTVSLVTEA